MKRFLIALTLTCVLSGSTLAGTIDTCGAPAPVSGGSSEQTAAGNIPTDGATSPGDMPTGGWSVVLTILDLAL